MTLAQVGEAEMEQPEKPVTAGQDATAQGGETPSGAGAPDSGQPAEKGAPCSHPEGGAEPAEASGETPQERAPEESEMIREIESLRAELESWKEKAEFNWDQFLRARADLDNYRKRVERDMASRIRMGKRDLLLGFLEVLDNLERVIEASRVVAGGGEHGEGEGCPEGATESLTSRRARSDLETLVTGVEMVKRQMEMLLQREGVRAVECLGRPFDPATQEAVEAVDGPGESGTVAEVVLKGYTHEGDLLRPARVKVVK